MANLITSSRLALLLILVWLAYLPNAYLQLLNLPLLIIIFALDGIDGYVARKRKEESLFGAIYDIAADRIVENVLWIVFADLDIVPVWVALVFIIRGLLIDSIRSHAASFGVTPFGMMQSPAGKFLVSGRFMRIFYAALKGTTFGYLFFIQPWPALIPVLYNEWLTPITIIKYILVYSSITICLLRGLPVLLEFIHIAKKEVQVQHN